MAERARNYEASIREAADVPAAVRNYVAEHGDTVEAGPLAGMRYPLELLLGAHMPLAKIQGVYERELDEHLAAGMAALERRPLFLDLGSSDGFYAAGIGKASGAAVVAFDIAPGARTATRALCEVNGVDCECRKAASPEALRDLGPDAGFVLCDIEGAEGHIFTAEAVEALAGTPVIIETHEPLNPGVEQTLRERFADSHDLTIVEMVPDDEWVAGLSEARADGIRWFVLAPEPLAA